VGYGIARRFADWSLVFDRRGREAVIHNLQRIHQHNCTTLSRRALRALAREYFLNFAKNLVDFFHFLHLSREQADQQRDTVPDVMNRMARAIDNGISVHSERWYLIHNLWDIESD
jgi:lauroyl/myristoyl acyltransferase